MCPYGRLMVFIFAVSIVRADVTKETAAIGKFQCTADLDEVKDPTLTFIGCDTDIMETRHSMCLPVFRTNTRGLMRIKFSIKRKSVTATFKAALGEGKGSIFFQPGKDETCIRALVSDDSYSEKDEVYLFQITEVSRGTIGRGNATITVLDNDS